MYTGGHMGDELVNENNNKKEFLEYYKNMYILKI